MARPVKSGYRSTRQRVFVLVDQDSAKGVFFTWDAAEKFADAHHYSLEKLMEYETRSDYPDHLHLMAAKWDADWIFQGEWSRRTPNWSSPPKQIRLDHYHAKGNAFHLLRHREFEWEEGLLLRINPMAPDSALESRAPTPTPLPEQKPHWQPQISPLKPLDPIPQPELQKSENTHIEPKKEQVSEPVKKSSPSPGKQLPRIVIESAKAANLKESETVNEVLPKNKEDQGAGETESPPKSINAIEPEPESELVLGLHPEKEPPKPVVQPRIPQGKSKLKLTPAAVSTNKSDDKKNQDQSSAKKNSKVNFKKKSSLRLRGKAGPTPIPSFQPAAIPKSNTSGKSSVELAQADPKAMSGKKPVEVEFTGKPKRIWSLKILFTLTSVVICWTVGIYWVLRPEPTAASLLAEITTMSRAKTIVVEPNMVFFQLEVDPMYQERYIRNLKLKPVLEENSIPIPTYHALDTWEKPKTFIRPPYADVEVDEWWDFRRRDIKYGFTKTWEDGSVLILDFESDTIMGWVDVKVLPEVLN